MSPGPFTPLSFPRRKAPKFGRWTPVTEQLPKLGLYTYSQKVLVYAGPVYGQVVARYTMFGSGPEWRLHGTSARPRDIEAWMPLPEDP